MARPLKITPERTTAICDAVLAGAPLATAASHGGIHEATLHRYRARGLAALEQADWEPENVPDEEQPFYEFCERVEQARRDWELRNVELIQRAANGRQWRVTRSVTEERRDKEGNPYKLTTVTVSEGEKFDWKAAAWLLERRYPRTYGRARAEAVDAESVGLEDQPTEVSLDEQVARLNELVDQLAAQRERRRAARKGPKQALVAPDPSL